jgi:hypothetical protein
MLFCLRERKGKPGDNTGQHGNNTPQNDTDFSHVKSAFTPKLMAADAADIPVSKADNQTCHLPQINNQLITPTARICRPHMPNGRQSKAPGKAGLRKGQENIDAMRHPALKCQQADTQKAQDSHSHQQHVI